MYRSTRDDRIATTVTGRMRCFSRKKGQTLLPQTPDVGNNGLSSPSQRECDREEQLQKIA